VPISKREAPLCVRDALFYVNKEETTIMARHAVLSLLLLVGGACAASAEMHIGLLVRVPFF
jgi:hypothetical protein